VSKQSLTVNGKRENLTRAGLLEVTQKMNITRAEHIISEIQQAINQWPEYENQAEVKEDLKSEIASTLLNCGVKKRRSFAKR
jgi:serine/threonine-protein kinase HipA